MWAGKIIASIGGVQIIDAVSEEAAFRFVVEDKADFALIPVHQYTPLRKIHHQSIAIAHVFTKEDHILRMVYSIRKDWPELVSIINKALSAIDMSEKQALFEKWVPAAAVSAGPVLPKPVQFDTTKFLVKNLGTVFGSLSVIIFVVWLLKGRPRQLSIRHSLFLISFVFAALIATSSAFVIMLAQIHEHEDDISARNYESLYLAFELKQSSDDLTRFARTYAVTGDPRYEHYFRKIIAMRDGRQAHPKNFNPFYWDYVSAGKLASDQDGDIYSIEKRMTGLGLSEEEMAKLSEAKRESDDLINLEDIAMNAVRGLYRDDEGRFTIKGDPDMKMARNLLYGKDYHEAKAKIMKPIDQFFTLLKWRMTHDDNQIHRRNEAIILGIMILVIITMGFSICVFLLMKRRIIFPLAVLEEGVRTIKKGDYSHHIDLTSSDEIGSLATAFNSMAGSIEENNSRLHATIESTTDGILVVDLHQKITTYNTRFLEIWHLDHALAEIGDDEILLNSCMTKLKEPEAFLNRVRQLYDNLEDEDFDTLLLRDGRIVERYSRPQRLGDQILGRIWSFRDVSERYRAEENIKKAKEHAELLYRVTPNAIFTVDLEKRITGWNNQAAKITGYSAEEMLGRKCTEFALHPCTQTCGFLSPDIPKPIFNRECTIRKKDGQVLTIRKNVDILTDSDGLIIGGIECFDDITERRQIEKELQKLSQAVAQSPGVVVITDTKGTIEYINPRFSMLTGYTAEEAIGRNPRIMKSGTHTPDFYKGMWSTIAAGNVWHGEICNRKKNGELYWESTAIAPVKNERGRITHYVAVKEDITERREMEIALTKSKEQLLEAAEISNLGYFELDLRTMVFTFDDLLWRLLGTSVEEEGGETIRADRFLERFCHPADRAIVEGHIQHALSAKKAFEDEVEYRANRKDGIMRNACVRYRIEFDEAGAPRKGYGFHHDITERRRDETELLRAKEAAEAAARAQSNFLANMSHEIRTPLHAMLGFLELVLEDRSLAEIQRRHLTTAQISANSLLGVINDILDISKLESGKLTIEQRTFSVSRLMHEIQSTMTIAAHEKKLYLELDIQPPGSGSFRGDPLRLRQILMNLLGNAIKFTQKGGVFIRVMPAEEEGHLHFMVEDTGIGIPADRLNTIFEPFVQADSSTTRRYGGTGLGTTIARELVELMGGRIWVESKEGKGSTFHFTISLPSTDQLPESNDMFIVPGKAVSPSVRRGFRILLVEDVQANADLARIRLEQQGHEVTVAWNGIEAVKVFGLGEFDVILMDIQMPIMGGLEATERIRSIESRTGGHVPIVAMTAAVMQEEAEKYLRSGMEAVVAKPINFGKLFKAMENVVPKEAGEVVAKAQENVPPPAETEYPPLDGIDIKKALRNWQDPDLYTKGLLLFAREYNDAAAELSRFVGEGDLDSAYRLVHKLKGVTGSLSITEVYNAATRLDNGLREKRMADVKEQLSIFTAVLDTAVEAIGQLEGLHESQKIPKKEIDIGHLEALFRDMLAAFDQYNPSVIEPFLHDLETYFSQKQLSPIVHYMERFDFDGAKQETVNFAKSFQVDLGGHNGKC